MRGKTFRDPKTGVWLRVCASCGEVGALEQDFYRTTHDRGFISSRAYWCKKCVTTRRREWRRNNPEREREAAARKRERVRKDPERLARTREYERMRIRLNREREGRPVKRSVSTAMKTKDQLPPLPVGPLVDFIESAANREGSMGIVAEQWGFDPRQVYGWKNGEYQHIQFDTVDRILTNAGVSLWEVYGDEVPS